MMIGKRRPKNVIKFSSALVQIRNADYGLMEDIRFRRKHLSHEVRYLIDYELKLMRLD